MRALRLSQGGFKVRLLEAVSVWGRVHSPQGLLVKVSFPTSSHFSHFLAEGRRLSSATMPRAETRRPPFPASSKSEEEISGHPSSVVPLSGRPAEDGALHCRTKKRSPRPVSARPMGVKEASTPDTAAGGGNEEQASQVFSPDSPDKSSPASENPLQHRRTSSRRVKRAAQVLSLTGTTDAALKTSLHRQSLTMPNSSADSPAELGLSTLLSGNSPETTSTMSVHHSNHGSDSSAEESLPSLDPISSQSSTNEPSTFQPFKRSKPLKLKESPESEAKAEPDEGGWHSLGINRDELDLHLTLPTGQTFRWRQTGDDEYTGVVGDWLLCLKQTEDDVLAKPLASTSSPSEPWLCSLKDYFNLSIPVKPMFAKFSEADGRFRQLLPFVTGYRILRQDPVECLFQFICSSNNNIGRISGMVQQMAKLGMPLGTVEGHEFYSFPSLETLLEVEEQQLRDLGFGYRAKFVVQAAQLLAGRGGRDWLKDLRWPQRTWLEAEGELMLLPGVGPKVAACVALFSLDQHSAIPVDTHVWRLSVDHYCQELRKKSLTAKAREQVVSSLSERFGDYTGWAVNAMFIAELPAVKKKLQLSISS